MDADTAAEVTKWKELYRRMRNVAAGYSNQCDENGSTRRLDKEFNAIDEEARKANDEAA